MHDEFSGFVMSPAVEGGRAGATITVETRGVRARTRDGGEFFVDFADAEFSRGGASGRMIFVRSRRTELIAGSEARGFDTTILEIADPVARDRFEHAVRADASRLATRRASGLKIALVLLAITAAIGVGLTWGARHVAGSIPRVVDRTIGDAYFASIESTLPIRKDPVVDAAFATILERLKPHADVEGFDLQVLYVDSEMVNAMALPGGRILVYRGLLETLEDENELAGVLAHELSHVTRRHHLTAIGRGLGLFAVAQLLIGDYGGVIVIGVEVMRHLAQNGYSRDQETDADLEAVRVLRAARLDPLALERALARMAEKVGSMPEAMKWLSTHPLDDERRAAIRDAAEESTRARAEALGVDWTGLKAAIARAPAAPR